MTHRSRAFMLGAAVVVPVATAWGCGARPGGGGLGIGTVGGGGGTELLDSGETSGYGGSGSGSSVGSGTSGSSKSGAASGSASAGATTGAASSGSSSQSGATSGGAGSSGISGGASGGGSGTSGAPTDAGDAGTGGIVLNLGGPIHLASLQWTISGPNTYQGSVEFGDAQSVEWVVGGIGAARGYRLAVTATDTAGDPCHGTSAPFDVEPGESTYTTITITCDTLIQDPADVGTGSVAIEAGVVAASD